MSGVNLSTASEFIRHLDDEILSARLESILSNRKPNRSTLDAIERMRKPDGGFSFWVHDVSSITSTLNVLGWFDDLSLKEATIVNDTFSFLIRQQQADGGWDEIKELRRFDPPLFMLPEEPNTRTWLTACCAHWFIRFGRTEFLGARSTPLDFLMQHLKPSGLISGFVYASWDSLVVFRNYLGDDSGKFKRLLTVVREGFEPERCDAADLAWLLRCLRDVNLGTEDELVVRVLDALQNKQEENGSWTSGDGHEYSGMTTIDSLRVLKDFGRIKCTS